MYVIIMRLIKLKRILSDAMSCGEYTKAVKQTKGPRPRQDKKLNSNKIFIHKMNALVNWNVMRHRR